MTEQASGAPKAKGRLSRLTRGAVGYGARRVQPAVVAEAGREVLTQGSRSALETLTPARASRADLRAGYQGRYGDGGRARFQQLMLSQGLSDEDLEIREDQLGRARIAFAMAETFFFVLGIVTIVKSGTLLTLLSGVVMALFGFVFAAQTVRSDFSLWQIRERRFGGLREYLNRRG